MHQKKTEQKTEQKRKSEKNCCKDAVRIYMRSSNLLTNPYKKMFEKNTNQSESDSANPYKKDPKKIRMDDCK